MWTLRSGGARHARVHRRLRSDGAISARLDRLDLPAGSRALIGIALRAPPTGDDPDQGAFVALDVARTLAPIGRGRPAAGATTSMWQHDHLPGTESAQPPIWLRLERRAGRFAGALSRDGLTWKPVDSPAWNGVVLPDEIEIDIHVASDAPGSGSDAAVFSAIRIIEESP